MPSLLASLFCISLLAAGAAAPKKRSLAPVPEAQAKSTHAPFEMGSCETCHQRGDPKDPGKVTMQGNAGCFACHEEYKGSKPVKLEKGLHPASKGACTACHSPHNAKKEKLLF